MNKVKINKIYLELKPFVTFSNVFHLFKIYFLSTYPKPLNGIANIYSFSNIDLQLIKTIEFLRICIYVSV